MAKRLTEKQKKEIIEGFKDGVDIDSLSKDFNCTKLTIIRNLKINLGEENYKKFLRANKASIKKSINSEIQNNKNLYLHKNKEVLNKITHKNINSNEIDVGEDFYPESSFLEISPIDYEIDNSSRKDLSSVPIEEVDLPEIVYMIVDKKIELEIKLLKEYPEWEFLPNEDLNRKTIEIHSDLKSAKRLCNKEQKVIKVPNTNVFKIAAPYLVSKGISRIVSSEKLISL